MKKWLIRTSVQTALRVLAAVARRPALEPLSNLLTRSMANAAVGREPVRRAGRVEELGPMWQRAFPSAKQVPIESVSESTVIAQIHTPCPLRGTGDVHACHRMMAFDRQVLARAGGQFVVLESQATPGVTVCRVAMRLEGASLDDLKPAHAEPVQRGA